MRTNRDRLDPLDFAMHKFNFTTTVMVKFVALGPTNVGISIRFPFSSPVLTDSGQMRECPTPSKPPSVAAVAFRENGLISPLEKTRAHRTGYGTRNMSNYYYY